MPSAPRTCTKDLEYTSIVYQIYGFYWCKFNYLNFPLKMQKNSR
ncbi:hypothetical protein NC652_038857 [Populus alba x Populus x berolinensis]|nr:hypothetical protein NC652_038857 [Populus alba x Populus x berolinensis]